MALESWQRYTASKPCPICQQECKGWLHKDGEHAFCSQVESPRMTDMHSLAVYLHPLDPSGQGKSDSVTPLPSGASAESFAEGVKVLSRFKKSPVAGASLSLVYGVDWQQRAYEEVMGRSWDKPFDPQFGYAGQRSKADKDLLKEVKNG